MRGAETLLIAVLTGGASWGSSVAAAEPPPADALASDIARELRFAGMEAEQETSVERAAERADKIATRLADLAHPQHAELAQKLDALRKTIDRTRVRGLRSRLANEKRAFDRNMSELNAGAYPEHVAPKIAEGMQRVVALVEENRAKLTGEEGRAFVTEVETWIAAAKPAFAAAQLNAEANLKLGSVHNLMKRTQDRLQANDARTALELWQTLETEAAVLRDPKFAQLPAVQAFLADYAKLAARMGRGASVGGANAGGGGASDVERALALQEAEPILRKAERALEGLGLSLDGQDEDRATRARSELLEAMRELREYGIAPSVTAFLGRAEEGLARLANELPKVLEKDVIDAEKRLEVPIELTQKALLAKDARVARRWALRVRAHAHKLRESAAHPRAQGMLALCDALLARVEKELGPETLATAPEDAPVPKIAIEVSAPLALQDKARELAAKLRRYERDAVVAEARILTLDFWNGVEQGTGRQVYLEVERIMQSLVRLAREAEALAREIGEPGASVVRDIPRLIKRAQRLKERAGVEADYAIAIHDARKNLDWVDGQVQSALKGRNADEVVDGLTMTFASLKKAANGVETAKEKMPVGHLEADVLQARLEKIQPEVRAKVIDACVTGAAEAMGNGYEPTAERLGAKLKAAFPDAAEITRIAKIIKGAKDAQANADADVQRRAEILRKRAQQAAEGFRPKLEAFKSKVRPAKASPLEVASRPKAWEGKWVALELGSIDHFQVTSGFWPLGDGVWRVELDPDLAKRFKDGLLDLDQQRNRMIQAVRKKHGAAKTPQFWPHSTQGTLAIAEVKGTAMYTPIREIKAPDGRVLATVQGKPYPVPHVLVKGVSSELSVIVAGQGSSFDTLSLEGVMP